MIKEDRSLVTRIDIASGAPEGSFQDRLKAACAVAGVQYPLKPLPTHKGRVIQGHFGQEKTLEVVKAS